MRRPLLALVLLSLISAFNFGDRQLIAVLAEPIRLEFGLSDTEMGLLTGPFFAVSYAALGLPLAWLADRTGRVRILAAACATWSLFTVLTGLAGSFLQMSLARVGVGVGEAGGTPPSHGLIAGFYGPAGRGRAMALFGYSGILGAAAGAAAGAWMAAAYDWRAAFVIVGAPGVVLAAALLLLVRDPSAPNDRSRAQDLSLLAGVRAYFQSPALLHITIAGCVSALLTYGLLNWLPAYLMREKGMSLGQVGSYFSVANAAFMGLGLLGAGYAGDRFAVRRPVVYAAIPGVALLVAAPIMVLGLAAPGWLASLLLLTLTSGLIITHAPLVLTLIQNTAPDAHRSTASAVYGLSATVTGLGAGPLLIGMISDAVGDLGDSMLALTSLFVVGAMFYLLAARRLAAKTPRAPDPASVRTSADAQNP